MHTGRINPYNHQSAAQLQTQISTSKDLQQWYLTVYTYIYIQPYIYIDNQWHYGYTRIKMWLRRNSSTGASSTPRTDSKRPEIINLPLWFRTRDPQMSNDMPRIWGDMGVSLNGGTPIAGWFISWKVPLNLGWWLRVPPFMEPPKSSVMINSSNDTTAVTTSPTAWKIEGLT